MSQWGEAAAGTVLVGTLTNWPPDSGGGCSAWPLSRFSSRLLAGRCGCMGGRGARDRAWAGSVQVVARLGINCGGRVDWAR
jgi:hypothetical protein